MKQVSAPLRAMRLRRAGSALGGNRQKRADGRKGIDQKEDGAEAPAAEKRTIGAWLNSFNAAAAGLVQSTILIRA